MSAEHPAAQRHECQRCGSDEWTWCDYRGCSECFEPESELCDDRSNPFPDGPTVVEPAVETLEEQVRMGIYGGGAYQATAIKALNRLVALSKDAS